MPGAAEPGQLRVLLVDDDSDVRDVTASILEAFGYHVTAAANGQAALDLLDGGADLDVHLFDFAMPGTHGVEVARQVESRKPAVPTVFITGYADARAMVQFGGPEMLAETLREATGVKDATSNVIPFARDLPAAG